MWGKLQENAFAKLCKRLNEERIHWMVMRNYEGLPVSNRSKDLDLGVSHKDFKKAHRIICEVMNEEGFGKVFYLRYQYAICSTFFWDNGKDLESIKIDLIDGFVWRGAQLVDFNDIYTRRVKYSNFFVPSQVDDGIMLLIKPLMTGGFIKEKYIPDIDKSLSDNTEEFSKIYRRIFGNKIYEKTWKDVSVGNYKALIPLKKEICNAAWEHAFQKNPISTVRNMCEHFLLEITRCISRKRPTMISVLGPDGVGKTTFLDLFIKEFSDLCVADVESLKVYHFRPNVLPNLKKLFGGKSYDESKEEFTNPHRGGRTSALSSFIRMGYYWLDYVVGYFLKVKLKCRHNGKVLFDRYISDFLVDPERARVYLPIGIRRCFIKFAPKADISYVLACDAETIYSRKKELTIKEINAILDNYNSIAAKDSRYVILDASISPESIVKQACREYIRKLDDITKFL